MWIQVSKNKWVNLEQTKSIELEGESYRTGYYWVFYIGAYSDGDQYVRSKSFRSEKEAKEWFNRYIIPYLNRGGDVK